MQNQLLKKLLYRTQSASVCSSIYRLFSTSLPPAEAITENPPLEPPFAVEYLTKSCGLSVKKAIHVSNRIPQLKSPAKPDSVLQFLREIGLDEAGIRKTVTNTPQILFASLENTIKPVLMEIREIGFSPSQVARLVPLVPSIFCSKQGSLQSKIEFWTSFLGSLEGVVNALRSGPYLLSVSIEKVIQPNLSFLEENCEVCPSQLRNMIRRTPHFLTVNPDKLIQAAKRAEELGSAQGSRYFIYALQVTLSLRPEYVDAKLNSLKELGFSQTEIESMISKHPTLLTKSEGSIRKCIQFLTSEAGLDLQSIAFAPKLISLSLERRIIPRHNVLISLKSKGLCEKWSPPSVMALSENNFVDKFVKRYEDIMPVVFEAYEEARTSKISRREVHS